MPSSSIELPFAVRRDGVLFPGILADVPTPYGVFPIRLVLDTGADCTMLPRSLGELLGFDFRTLRRMTVTGVENRGIAAHKATVTLRIANLMLPPIPCLYTDSERAPALLGREGFFDLFNITFDNRRKKIVLTPLFR